MNAPIRPLATCPLCKEPIEYWPAKKPFQDCRKCLRPLTLLPVASTKPRAYRIASVLGMGKQATAILALGTLLSLSMNLGHLNVLTIIVVTAFLVRGAFEAADGMAGIKSGIDFSWGRMRNDTTARRRSYAKIAIGLALLGMGVVGIGAS